MRTVLALHGFTGGPASFDVLRGLDARILAPPLAGHAGAPAATSFDGEAARLLGMLEAAEGPVVVVGYSLGGRLALRMLGLAPSRFAACVVIGAHLGLANETERLERRRSDADWAEVLRSRGVDAFAEQWACRALFASQAALPAEATLARQALRRSHSAPALADSLEALSLGRMPDLRDGVARYDGRAHFVAGDLDAKFSTLAREGAALAQHGELTIVPHAGHDVGLEKPLVVAQIVREVLGVFA